MRQDTGSVVDTVVVSGWARTTQGPDLLFTAAALTPYTLDQADATSMAHMLQEATRMAGESGLYIPDYYPVAPGSVLAVPRRSFHDLRSVVQQVDADNRHVLDPARQWLREDAIVAKLNRLYTRSAWLTGFDRIVVVMRRSDFDLIDRSGAQAFAPSQKVVFVKPDSDHWDVAHEVIHTLPHLWTSGQMQAACGIDYHPPAPNSFGNGHRITLGGAENRERMTSLPGLMGAATVDKKYWIEQCTYKQLLDVLPSIPDPELLAVQGWLLKGDEGLRGGFSPGLTILGEPDLPDGSRGEYTLMVRGAAGQVLGRHGFTPHFAYDHGREATYISFGYRIPRPAGAARIELLGPGGQVLDSRAISAAAPTVTIAAPAAGATVQPGPGGVTVRWTAADPDGDALTYSVLYSPDGGKIWWDAAMDVAGTELEIPSELLVPGGDHLLRVVASDGFNSTAATLAAPFRLAGEGGSGGTRTIRLTVGSSQATVNGVPVPLEAPARIVEGRTRVPLRFVAEALGARVSFDNATKQITIELDGTTVELWLGQTRASIGGRETQLDVPPLVTGGRSLVPLRFVAEALGAGVEWDNATKTVTIRR